MKLRSRILALSLTLSLLVMIISGVFIIEGIHNSILDKEIEDMLEYSEDIRVALMRIIGIGGPKEAAVRFDPKNNEIEYLSEYFRAIEKKDFDYILRDASDAIAYKTSGVDFESCNAIANNAKTGVRSYMLYKDGDRFYISVGEPIRLISNRRAVLISRKDISFIMESRRDQYANFIIMMLSVGAVLAITLYYFSLRITRDVNELIYASEKIADGAFSERVSIQGDDEIALLARRFNYMADEVEDRIEELEKVSSARQRFINNITHEMRTPLTSIIGYAELIRSNPQNREIHDKGLRYIYDEGKRLETLNKRLADIIIFENMTLKLEDIDLDDLLERIIAISSHKASEKDIVFKLDNTTLKFTGDPQLLTVVLCNLVDNAIKASELSGRIELGAYLEEGCLRIYVRDFGKGIPQALMEKVTEPFFTSDSSRNRNHSGLGLGLSICDQITKLHKGQLLISSEVDKGTCVEIECPI